MNKYLISFKYIDIYENIIEGLDIFETDKEVGDVTLEDIKEWCKDHVNDRRAEGQPFHIYKIEEIDDTTKHLINKEYKERGYADYQDYQ